MNSARLGECLSLELAQPGSELAVSFQGHGKKRVWALRQELSTVRWMVSHWHGSKEITTQPVDHWYR